VTSESVDRKVSVLYSGEVMPKTEILILRVSSEFKKKIAEEAKRQHRSITNYIEATLIELWSKSEDTLPSLKRKRR
jgi:hypothetical protein